MQTTTTPLAALWRECRDAASEYEAAGQEPEDSPAWQRYIAADDALAAARPSDLAGCAAQLRWLAHLVEGNPIRCDEAEGPVLIHIAKRLEAMAPDG